MTPKGCESLEMSQGPPPRLEQAVALLNQAQPRPLKEFLLQLLHAMVQNKIQNLISQQKLAQNLKLDHTQFDLLLFAAAHLYESAASKATSAPKIKAELLQKGLNEETAQLFTEAWVEGSPPLVASLRERAALAPLHLKGIDWKLLVSSADSSGWRGRGAYASLELELSGESKGFPVEYGGGDEGSSLGLCFDAPGLEGLLCDLDRIQSDLDRLHAPP